ncbi:MAG: monofunctional biosynthetic peptidoglycan transglycosylase [Rhodospirillales bacterium]|nr:monofunctional biosynthetic peptidoglycan transglycosylase [Rhodospirillales bacterium]
MRWLRTLLRSVRRWVVRGLLFLIVAPTVIIGVYRFVDPPLTPLMVIRVIEGESVKKYWRTLGQISPHLVKSVIAAEDNRFCEHFGFDVDALRQEVQALLDGDRPRGASTITMQTAKNILLWPGRDPLRKVFEAWLTPQIELFWSKRRILEVYLNIAETGPGLYGVEAAAHAYFGRGAGDLTPEQAARIAAILPNPREWSPDSPSAYIRHRVGVIRHRIGQLGRRFDCVQE